MGSEPENLISIPDVVPAQKHDTLANIVEELARASGIVAMVLGGSYATGMQSDTSDLDIGLYYSEAAPFAIDEIRHIATEFAVGGEPVVTDFYEWGAWVNGGAWIQTDVGKVDFLYRSLEHVSRTIGEAKQGIIHHDYGQQPPYGFYSVIYLAETHICIPLYDLHEEVAARKREVVEYPPQLKRKIIESSLWSAEFTFLHSATFAAAGDVYNTVGCLTRIAANLTQTLFALNESYFLTDKKMVVQMDRFAHCPPGYIENVMAILARPGGDRESLSHSVTEIRRLWQQVVDLAGSLYTPQFQLP